jgi:hypothetical protein
MDGLRRAGPKRNEVTMTNSVDADLIAIEALNRQDSKAVMESEASRGSWRATGHRHDNIAVDG